MTLPLNKKYRPMEAMPASELPPGPEWQYEPKWDGFRCLAFRDGKRVDLESKAGKPLTRYFPELASRRECRPDRIPKLACPASRPKQRGTANSCSWRAIALLQPFACELAGPVSYAARVLCF